MIPWRPLMLTSGLFMVVEALHANGLTQFLAGIAGTGESLPALLQLAGLGAGAANAVNNLPAYLALEPVGGSPARLAALLIGVNLGPLVTPWASLATLLWHERLRTLNVRDPLGRLRPGRPGRRRPHRPAGGRGAVAHHRDAVRWMHCGPACPARQAPMSFPAFAAPAPPSRGAFCQRPTTLPSVSRK